jgi:DNA-binding transcriptional LysR family regulator
MKVFAMRRRIQLTTLDCTLVIAEEGSFLGASRRVGIHHSALSRRIRDLEHVLGTAIFERYSGGVRPTPAGTVFLGTLRGILTDLDRALETAATGRRGNAGSLSTDLDASLHAIEFLQAIAAFIRSRPEVALQFVGMTRAETADHSP